jgi:hypothetical protein
MRNQEGRNSKAKALWMGFFASRDSHFFSCFPAFLILFFVSQAH